MDMNMNRLLRDKWDWSWRRLFGRALEEISRANVQRNRDYSVDYSEKNWILQFPQFGFIINE